MRAVRVGNAVDESGRSCPQLRCFYVCCVELDLIDFCTCFQHMVLKQGIQLQLFEVGPAQGGMEQIEAVYVDASKHAIPQKRQSRLSAACLAKRFRSPPGMHPEG